MSHQPYENWLFTKEDIEPEHRQALSEHLLTCPECSQRAKALESVEMLFADSSTPSPKPGFAHRWQTHLSLYREKRQQKRMLYLTLVLFSLAAMVFIGLFLIHQTNFNWIYSLSQFIANFSLFAVRVNQIWQVFQTLTTNLPILIPVMIVFGVGTLSALFVLIITWVNSMIKLYQPVKQGVQ